MTLLRVGVVPLINENDTIATDEIRFGDNDRLAARVASMVSADLLILLSNINGLYTADPAQDKAAKLVPTVTEITHEIEAMASNTVTSDSSGGMPTKLAAAKQCLGAGCRMIICEGRGISPLKSLENGGDCTWFIPSGNPQTARKRWISGSLQSLGSVIVDDGAVAALERGRSLLPAGILRIEGTFQRGDAITIMNKDGSMNENAGERYVNLDRFECRSKLWKDMEDAGIATKSEKHSQRIPRSQRGGEVIEPMVSSQWFVKAQGMGDKAMKVVEDGEVQIVPKRFEKVRCQEVASRF